MMIAAIPPVMASVEKIIPVTDMKQVNLRRLTPKSSFDSFNSQWLKLHDVVKSWMLVSEQGIKFGRIVV